MTNVASVAHYFLQRTIDDGELISPLKMQKLVYYAYVWVLVKLRIKLFDESMQAWPNGPVVPSLYHLLKGCGSSPIDVELLNEYKDEFSVDVLGVIDDVYNKYQTFTAFELVGLTHSETPWKNAREGLSATDMSSNEISDEDIVKFYSD
jgi:uncharacterized phage-associated protein